MKGCKFCDPTFGTDINDDMKDTIMGEADVDFGILDEPTLSLWMNNLDGSIFAALLDKHYNILASVSAQAKYCPMCGRKLLDRKKVGNERNKK